LETCWLVRLFYFKDNFTCKYEIEKKDKKVINEDDNLTLILSEDAFILFEKIDENYGKICFWSTLYSLVDMQINKLQKIASINFYNDENVKY